MSAANVIQYLDRSRFDVVPIGIDKQGVWLLGNSALQKELTSAETLSITHDLDRVLFNPDLLGKRAQQIKPMQFTQEQRIFDVIFPVIHGPLCEDGTVQGLLELADIPYVGCGVLASAVGMDKDVSKRLALAAGIPVPPYLVIKRGEWEHGAKDFLPTRFKSIATPSVC